MKTGGWLASGALAALVAWLATRKKRPPTGEVYIGPVQVLTAKQAGMSAPTDEEMEQTKVAAYIRNAIRLDLDLMAPTVAITPEKFRELAALIEKLPKEDQSFHRDLIEQARDYSGN